MLKDGGFIIECPGEDERENPNGPSQELIDKGFDFSYYKSKSGGDLGE